MIGICREFVEGAGDGWMDLPWHFLIGNYSVELRDQQAAQKSYSICFSRRYKPVESLQRLCSVYFRCGAFEQAEGSYRQLINLFGQGNDLLKLGETFQKRLEDWPPAFNLALAANHTAAALAEQGLVHAAGKRWTEGRDWGQKFLSAAEPGLKTDYARRWLGTAQSFCKGLILLNAGKASGFCPDPVDDTSPPGDTRVAQLQRAIDVFTESIGFAFALAARADANFRIGLACEELARLDTPNAANWRMRADDVLRNASLADRRGEYDDRIKELRQRLGAAPETPAPSTAA
jgi:tetratricopeptide (TPR) repeat protein